MSPAASHLSCDPHPSSPCVCSRSLSSEICALTRLTYLNLSNNMLDNLPGGMAALGRLQANGVGGDMGRGVSQGGYATQSSPRHSTLHTLRPAHACACDPIAPAIGPLSPVFLPSFDPFPPYLSPSPDCRCWICLTTRSRSCPAGCPSCSASPYCTCSTTSSAARARRC